MGIKEVRRREYRGAEVDGNVFDWLVEESERIRYWAGRGVETKAPIIPLKSLRSNNVKHTTSSVLHFNEPSSNAAREHTFEISKARKL